MISKPVVQYGNAVSPFLIADLISDPRDVPEVRLTDLSSYQTAREEDQSIVEGFCFLPSKNANHTHLDKSYLKALEKGSKVVARVTQFLERPSNAWSNESFDNDTVQNEKESSSILIEDALLVGGPPCEGHARNIEGISSFHQIDFDFRMKSQRNIPTFLTSSQLVHFSSPTLNVDGRLFGPDGRTEFSRVDIVSGVCLFNSNTMQQSQSITNGLQVDQLFCKKPTLYEMEYIARSSTAIADFASHILLNSNANIDYEAVEATLPICINLDVPSFHYYGSIDKLVTESRITASEALQWLEGIVSRSEKITEVFKQAITKEIQLRLQADHLPHNLTFSVSPGRGSVVWSCLQNALQNGMSPSVQDTLERLANECDDSWNLFLSFLPPKEQPQDFRDLGYTFYVYQCVRPALMRTGLLDSTVNTQPKKQRQLLLSIDDGVERRIYSRAQKLLKKIRRSPQESIPSTELIEAYLSRRVFINSNKAGSNLYLDDPSPNKPRLLQSESRARSGLEEHSCRSVDSDAECPLMEGSELDPIDIITALYGDDHARSLESLFAQVGLAG